MMSLKARIIGLVFGLLVLVVVSFLVRRRKLYNIYAITWFMISLLLIAISVVPGFVEGVAALLGIYSTQAAILVAAVGGMMAIVLHLSIIVTDQHKQIRQFEKELALLKKQQP